MRPEWTKRINPFAKTENARLHFRALNIPRGHIIENHVPADVVARSFLRKVLAGFLQHHRKFKLIIQLFGQMLWINDLLLWPDDRVHILKKHNPGQHGMRKPGLLRFLMVFAEISGRVKEFLWSNGSFDFHRVAPIENRLARGASDLRPFFHRIVKRQPSSVQPAITIGKEASHVSWNASVCERVERDFPLNVPQIQRVSRVEVHDQSIGRERSDAVLARLRMERDKYHRDSFKSLDATICSNLQPIS